MQQNETRILQDPRWVNVVDRNKGADGSFVYAVKTTGVYCRPSCPSRTAHPKNVRFFTSVTEAEQAGFRACLRCNPKGKSLAEKSLSLVMDICRRIEQSDEVPKLRDLAASVGMSPSYLHRRFKAITGLTPKAYSMAHRTKQVREELTKPQSSVTQAIYGAGFTSSSRFYERSNEVLGMTPTEFRRGGNGTDIRFAVGECSLGAILVAASDKGVCAITLSDDPEELVQDLQDRFPNANFIGGDTAFEKLVAQVIGFVEAPRHGFDLPLDIRGTAFQQRVWQALRDIPAGQTASYTEIAQRIGKPTAVRAVAQACGANKLSVAIPCHRVVRSDGGLSGYRWGVERKRALLEREAEG